MRPPSAQRDRSLLGARLGGWATLILLFRSCAIVGALLSSATISSAGTSANYTLAPDILDQGGQRGTSTDYTLNLCLAPGGQAVSPNYTARTGFAGQLADATATVIGLTPAPAIVNEGATRQLIATMLFDDLSTSPLAASSIIWNIQSGPLTSISPSGLATAAIVYQDTPAVVQGSYLTFTDTLTLNILNTLPDNFGNYGGDAIDDAWQVQYFGLNHTQAGPLADPDADGQNNLLEYTAGVIPIDPNSRFLSGFTEVPGQPGQWSITFSPRLADRTYSIKTSTSLANDSWLSLVGGIIIDNGNERTVTDPNPTQDRKFYRVDITKP